MLRSFVLFGLLVTAALSQGQFHAPSAFWQVGAPNRAAFAGAVSVSRSGKYAIYTQQILSQEGLSAAHVYDISTGTLKWSLPCRALGSFKPLVGFDAQDNLLFGLPQKGLWRQDIATREIQQLTTSDSPVSMLKVSPDGKKVAYFYANENGATVGLRLLSLESSVVLCSIPFLNGSQFFDFEWMPDSGRIVVPGPNVYSLDGTQVVTRANPGGTIVLSPDGTVIYSVISGFDGGVEVRASKANGNRIWTTPWPAGAAIEDALTSDGKFFLGLAKQAYPSEKVNLVVTSATPDLTERGRLELPDSAKAARYTFDTAHSRLLTCYDKVVDHLYLGYHPFTAFEYDTLAMQIQTLRELGTRLTWIGSVRNMIDLPNGLEFGLVEGGTQTFPAPIWNSATGAIAGFHQPPSTTAYDDCVSPDGKYGYVDGKIYNRATATVLAYTTVSGGTTRAKAASRGGRFLGVSSGAPYVWRWANGVLTKTFNLSNYSIDPEGPLAFADNGLRLAVTNAARTQIRVYDTVSGALLGSIPMPSVPAEIFLVKNYLIVQHFESGTTVKPKGNTYCSVYKISGGTATLTRRFTQYGEPNPPDSYFRSSRVCMSPDAEFVAMLGTDASPADNPSLGQLIQPSLAFFRMVDGGLSKVLRGPELGAGALFMRFTPDSRGILLDRADSAICALEAYPVMKSVVFAPTSVQGGNIAKATITLSIPAPAGGTTVLLNTASTALLPNPQVFIPAGSKSLEVLIPTKKVFQTKTATLNAILDGQIIKAKLTIVP